MLAEARCVGALIIVYYMLPDTRSKSDHNKVVVLVQVRPKITMGCLGTNDCEAVTRGTISTPCLSSILNNAHLKISISIAKPHVRYWTPQAIRL